MRPLDDNMRPLAILAGFVGICVSSAVLFIIEASISSEIREYSNRIAKLPEGDEERGKVVECCESLQITGAVVLGLGLVAIAVQLVCLFNLTRSKDYFLPGAGDYFLPGVKSTNQVKHPSARKG